MRRSLAPVAVIAMTVLFASCSAQENEPSGSDAEVVTNASTAAAERDVEYAEVEDLRDAVESTGFDCSGWEERAGSAFASAAGDCDQATVLSIFDSTALRDEQAETITAIATEKKLLLVGPNWIVNGNPEDLEAIRRGIGGDMYEGEPAAPDVTPEDLSVSLRVTEQKCFGSAGCRVTVEPTLDVESNLEGVTAGGFDVTIEYTGGEDGSILRTITMDEGGEYSYQEERVSTASAEDEITAEIVDVHYSYSG